MSEDVPGARDAIADVFDADTDPLEQYESRFDDVAVDPFAPFRDVLEQRDLAETTKAGHERVWRQWCARMDQMDRHPACPNEDHVRAFAHHEREVKSNTARTIAEKLRKLNEVYRYWQSDPVFPHEDGYNPFALAKATLDLSYHERKDPPRLSIETLRETLDTIVDVRDYAIICLQLKLGLRATELCNLRLDEISLDSPAIESTHDTVGTHPLVSDRRNVVLIPHTRAGNKSRRSRLLPIDEEMRRILEAYLFIRPTNGEPWVFLTKNRQGKLRKKAVNDRWKDTFHPEYAETEQYRAITSHYGRHYFTTYWRVQEDLSRELLKYMRGDTPGAEKMEERGAIDEYIHTYYEDIESVYREQMFELNPENSQNVDFRHSLTRG
jgi:integrase/recombinase XerD